jgi:hypothetical protein
MLFAMDCALKKPDLKKMCARHFLSIFLGGACFTLMSWMIFVSCSSAQAASPVLLTPQHSQDRATELGMVGHKALYHLRLKSAKSGSQILDISGKMFYEWKPSCDGWLTKHRFNITYNYADAAPMVISNDFSTFESFDGSTLDFISRRHKDGQLYEELRGQGLRAGAETKNPIKTAIQTNKAVYSVPEGLTFDLSANAVFPTGHSVQLLEAIRAGQKFYTTQVFDGSDDQGPVEINSVVGRVITDPIKSVPAEAQKNIDKTLMASPARQVRMAFFPKDSETEMADYELTMTYHDNGVKN